jgi:phosphoinositide-3-kinase regulatory subunit 4
VICEALSCLSTLVSLSLLTRTSLLGTNITGSSALPGKSPTRSRRKKQGVIEKCGPLLIHSSSIVRRRAAYLVCMSSQVLGVADSEVIANQLLKPYLQYKPTFESIPHLLACAKVPSLRKPAANPSPIENIQAEFEISAKLAKSLSVPSQQSVELVTKSDFSWYVDLLRQFCNAAIRTPRYVPSHHYPSPGMNRFTLLHRKTTHLVHQFIHLGLLLFRKVRQFLGFMLVLSCLIASQLIILLPTLVLDLNIELSTEASNHILINMIDENRLARHVRNNKDLTDNIITCILNRPVVRIAESACKGEWGSAAFIDQLCPENSHAHSKILALDVPPLSPCLGLARNDHGGRHTWCPKENKLLSTGEHSGPVNRLAVSEDQNFFVSASYDGTSKVFELRQVHDSGGSIHSCLTYEGHKTGKGNAAVRVNDCCILEHSNSIATAASDGSLHVWRVDLVTSNQNQQMKKPRVSGHSALRSINVDEGEVLAVSHFNTPSASVLAFATQRGRIHSLDIRSAREPFTLNLRPELGYLTDMEVGKDRNWVVAGTSRGYVALWDIRFRTMVKLWRHCRDSPIRRLIDAFGTCQDEDSRPYVFMGCDNNEASLFDVSTGGCLQCCRILDSSLSYVDQLALPGDCLSIPYLESVNIPSRLGKRLVSLDKALRMTSRKSTADNSIIALAGCISPQGPSYLMTGGTDNMIRLWDLKSASKSSCVSGLERNQSPPSFEQVGGNSRLILCRQHPIRPIHLVESSKLPMYNRRGVSKCENRHIDSILDLKVVQNPALLLSASRDHTIKLWA